MNTTTDTQSVRYTLEGAIIVYPTADLPGADLGYFDADGGEWEPQVTAILWESGYELATAWTLDAASYASLCTVRPVDQRMDWDSSPAEVESSDYDLSDAEETGRAIPTPDPYDYDLSDVELEALPVLCETCEGAGFEPAPIGMDYRDPETPVIECPVCDGHGTLLGS